MPAWLAAIALGFLAGLEPINALVLGAAVFAAARVVASALTGQFETRGGVYARESHPKTFFGLQIFYGGIAAIVTWMIFTL